jgi:putative ABC transport system substrate-binding protein
MRRRQFLCLATGAAFGWPTNVRAQQLDLPIVGFLSVASASAAPNQVDAFRQGLAEIGFVEGRSVTIEYRWAEGRYERLPELVTDLVRRQVKVIAATFGDVGIMAAKAATSTIPIVFTTGSDPVRIGLVARLNRPGGNLTGVSFFTVGLLGKRMGLLHELVPSGIIGVLLNPDSPEAPPQAEDARTAARELGRHLIIENAHTADEIDAAFAEFGRQGVKALLIAADPYFSRRGEQIVALAARYAIPTSYGRREFVPIGGLMGYGTSFSDAYHKAGGYVGRVLKGENPADLPILQPTKFEFAINVKTAKALGLQIPPKFFYTADEVIE